MILESVPTIFTLESNSSLKYFQVLERLEMFTIITTKQILNTVTTGSLKCFFLSLNVQYVFSILYAHCLPINLMFADILGCYSFYRRNVGAVGLSLF